MDENLLKQYEEHMERFSQISQLTDENIAKFKNKVFKNLSELLMYNEVYALPEDKYQYLSENQIDIINKIKQSSLFEIMDDYQIRCHWLISKITEDSTLDEIREFIKDILFLDYKLKILELELSVENLDSNKIICILTNSIMYVTLKGSNITREYEMLDFIKSILT